MKTEYHRWYSHRLGLDMGIVVYGHWGPPLMGFPTSAGDEWELDRQGMISALAPLIDAGRVKFFSVNSVNWAGLYNKGAHPFHRRAVHLGQLPIAGNRNFDHGRVIRRVSRSEHFVQTSGRDQTLLRPFRCLRHPRIHERNVRRQHLLQ
jgi:hypothetical protein